MLPCRDCAYRENIPGDCHFSCSYNWEPEEIVALMRQSHVTSKTSRWFRFPFNFDPVWGPDKCTKQSAEATNKVESSPLRELFKMLR